MTENTLGIRTMENKGNQASEQYLEEWKKNKDFGLGV